MFHRLGFALRPCSALAALALAAATASAQVDVYGNQADYDAAVGAEIFSIDFDGNPAGGAVVPGGSFSGAVTFNSPESFDPTRVLWNSGAISDNGSMFAANFVGPISGTFTDPVHAFAVVFLSVEADTPGTVHLYDGDGVLIDSVPAPGTNGFFGVVSATPIKAFFIDNGTLSTGNPDRFFLDDFRANELAPDAPSLDELLDAVCGLIDSLDPATDLLGPNAGVRANRKNALQNRCNALDHAVAACDIDDALDQLASMRAKADGAGANDWVQGAAAAALVAAIDDLVEALEAHVCE
jgi:hypothetical protein